MMSTRRSIWPIALHCLPGARPASAIFLSPTLLVPATRSSRGKTLAFSNVDTSCWTCCWSVRDVLAPQDYRSAAWAGVHHPRSCSPSIFDTDGAHPADFPATTVGHLVDAVGYSGGR